MDSTSRARIILDEMFDLLEKSPDGFGDYADDLHNYPCGYGSDGDGWYYLAIRKRIEGVAQGVEIRGLLDDEGEPVSAFVTYNDHVGTREMALTVDEEEKVKRFCGLFGYIDNPEDQG